MSISNTTPTHVIAFNYVSSQIIIGGDVSVLWPVSVSVSVSMRAITIQIYPMNHTKIPVTRIMAFDPIHTPTTQKP